MVRVEALLSKDRLEVSEADYVHTNEGPGDDTGAFYVGTPRPGNRDVDDRAAPAQRTTAQTPIWIKRVGRPTRSNSLSIEIRPENRWAIAVMVIGGLLTMFSMAVILLWLFWPHSTDAPGDAQVEPEAEQRYQGLKVKKGLQ